VAPEATEKDKSCWTWRMKDFEPNADVLIQYRVYSGAKEAIEKLSTKLKANGSDIEAWLDYADNLVATEQPLRAAEAFVRLHELEAQTGHAVHRARTEYQPPAYRAAKCYHDAGKADEARDWAKKAKARLQEVAAKEHPIVLRKVLRTSKEALEKCVEECKAWAGD
jgi:tetratricopeptide (TPR) repeat protein